ncbi:50S ribosomal protein L10 [Candidatus Hodgkinia cicadicola]|uniref:50S ribosomal protein L10 n=1 Tax=Candidatus Hodgkinia cicadicola TaxID=573658 RepID=A0ABX4MGU5_9HYPH|nr:50S ribosomal protein L10 [Candidatus Hodgkinia cicadicola]
MKTNITKFNFERSVLTSFKSFIIITSDNVDHNSFYKFKQQLYTFDSFMIKIKNSHSRILLNKIIKTNNNINLTNIINKNCTFIMFDELTFELWNVIRNFIKSKELDILIFVSKGIIISTQDLDFLSHCENINTLKLCLIKQLKQFCVNINIKMKQTIFYFHKILKYKHSMT